MVVSLSHVNKRRSVQDALLENPRRSNPEIAGLVGCTKSLVLHVRRELEHASAIERYTAPTGPPKDKELRDAIRGALLENDQRSSRDVARSLGTGYYLAVRQVRVELEQNGSIAKYRNKHVSSQNKIRQKEGTVTDVARTSENNGNDGDINYIMSSWLYAVCPTGGGLTKIGFTWNVARRFKHLQAMSPVPLVIMWQAHGDEEVEAYLHATFAAKRHHGEWFDLGADPIGRIEDAISTFEQKG